ncbi:MAG: tRNA (guanosine(37)-N1)-methyltransferase TrmD [Gammaproteobacteria bacterium]|nr:tRNA (guanosine(37)-N1)-methyltransferase TrmD [Gammaproteobacteria bacterium]
MWIGLVTLFPEMFQAVTDFGITGRACRKGLVELACWNPRDFAGDRHQTVDDKPYGGGPGMLMKVEPLQAAIRAAKAARPDKAAKCPVIYLAPQGEPLRQQTLASFAQNRQMIFIAGRYEGIDERLIAAEVDAEISIGDYVLSGGEIPAMVMIDGITRLLPGALGDDESAIRESFTQGLLDYPQYTRPEQVDGQAVPEVLLSGHHGEIERWRRKQALGRTWQRRPDLIRQRQLSQEEQLLLDEYMRENRNE